ncbi:MAG: hypothetical protein U0W40_07035 [Acidimicrobiia bacterium]
MSLPRTRRTRRLAVAALVAAIGLVAAACAPPPPEPVPPTTVGVTHSVATYQTTFTDFTRATPALDAYPGAPYRSLPTSVWYPTDRQNGPYPLVMFAHGYGVTPQTYAALLTRIAQAGYVVVAPTYPILSGQPAGPSDTVGWADLWPDTWFVTTQVLDQSAAGTGVLGNLVDPQRIAVAGHSDGGYISFGDGFQPFRLDARVRAVVSYAASFAYAGSYQPNGRAILHVHSDIDEYNPFDEAVAWDAANLQEPKTVMSLVNGTHLAPYSDPNDPHFSTVVTRTIVLDTYLKAHPRDAVLRGLDVA